MGVWGTDINSNDTYADVYEQFIDLYNEGVSVQEVTKRLIDENQETIDLPEDATNFWFAVANAQWECKELDEKILLKVEQIIKSGEDLRVWEELGASKTDLKIRKKVLDKFLLKINTEKEKPKRRTKKKLYSSIFKKGDCLTYIMNNSNYGGAFVLTDEENTELGLNYIAITTIDQPQKPTLSDFENTDIYIQHAKQMRRIKNELKEYWGDKVIIGGFNSMLFKKSDIDIEVIDQLPLYKEYIIKKDQYMGFGWIALKIYIPFRTEYEKINGKAKQSLKLSEWTKSEVSWLGKLFKK